MTYCSKCGKQMEDGATFCSGCGAPLQNVDMFTTSNIDSSKKPGMGIASLVLGITGLLAWIIPIIGLPVGVTALVLGILGIKRSGKGMSIAGLVLGIICLVLTIINSSIGAYQGYHGEAWFQKGSNGVEEKSGDYTSETQEQNVFTLRDSDGNILMTGGIKSTNAIMIDSKNGVTNYAVEIIFDEAAAKTLADITINNIGNTIGLYLNNDMIANPIVSSAITDGKSQLQVNTYEEALVLSEALKTCN